MKDIFGAATEKWESRHGDFWIKDRVSEEVEAQTEQMMEKALEADAMMKPPLWTTVLAAILAVGILPLLWVMQRQEKIVWWAAALGILLCVGFFVLSWYREHYKKRMASSETYRQEKDYEGRGEELVRQYFGIAPDAPKVDVLLPLVSDDTLKEGESEEDRERFLHDMVLEKGADHVYLSDWEERYALPKECFLRIQPAEKPAVTFWDKKEAPEAYGLKKKDKYGDVKIPMYMVVLEWEGEEFYFAVASYDIAAVAEATGLQVPKEAQ